MKITESLNPDAEEWRPIPQPPPLLLLPIIQTPPPPPPPLQRLSYYYYYYYYYYFYHPHYPHCLQPINTISFPAANQFLLKAANAATPLCEEKEIITEQEIGAGGEEKETVSPREQNPAKKGFKKGLPPRLRRAFRAKKPPPKKEWKQKNTTTKNLKSSGEGGVAASLPPSPASKTTVMIKNIPSQLRRNFMLKFLDGRCRRHSLEYDFLYLPIDFRRLGNLGYAFVNLTSATAAVKLMNVLNNYKWRTIYTEEGEAIISKKICEITWARIQGKEALIRTFEKSSFNCNVLEFLPVVFDPPRNGSNPNSSPPVTLGRIRC